jgi:hypothetical protein
VIKSGGLRLSIDGGAIAWIQHHGGAVTLRESPRHGCCGGTALLPVAEPRTPRRPDDWAVRQIDGVIVYIEREFEMREGPLTIRAAGFGRWQRLFVERAESHT